ncbi:MAG: hypothetical protein PPHEMADMSA_6177, partial [uncultured Paraburkholderia sp.]
RTSQDLQDLGFNMPGPCNFHNANPTAKPRRARSSALFRPDYKGWEHWDSRRWAWEFLRRNQKFREECDAVRGIKKKEIASAFMLRYYRRYDRPYDEKPRVAFAGVSSSPKPISTVSIEWPATLAHDQIALVFHLRPALHSKTAVKEPLVGAERILQSRVNHIRGLETQQKMYPQPHLDKPKFLLCLRLLDATSSSGCNADAAKVKLTDLATASWIKRDTRWRGPKVLVADNIRKMLDDSAKPFAEFGYIAIATASTRHERMPVKARGS